MQITLGIGETKSHLWDNKRTAREREREREREIDCHLEKLAIVLKIAEIRIMSKL